MPGLGTPVYKKYGSSDLLEIIASLGCCNSFHDIRLFDASTINSEQGPIYKNPYIQLVFNNPDHNTAMVDGKNTFHCMGGIQIVTPYTQYLN